MRLLDPADCQPRGAGARRVWIQLVSTSTAQSARATCPDHPVASLRWALQAWWLADHASGAPFGVLYVHHHRLTSDANLPERL
jgi:hypothetical protein